MVGTVAEVEPPGRRSSRSLTYRQQTWGQTPRNTLSAPCGSPVRTGRPTDGRTRAKRGTPYLPSRRGERTVPGSLDRDVPSTVSPRARGKRGVSPRDPPRAVGSCCTAFVGSQGSGETLWATSTVRRQPPADNPSGRLPEGRCRPLPGNQESLRRTYPQVLTSRTSGPTRLTHILLPGSWSFPGVVSPTPYSHHDPSHLKVVCLHLRSPVVSGPSEHRGLRRPSLGCPVGPECDSGVVPPDPE